MAMYMRTIRQMFTLLKFTRHQSGSGTCLEMANLSKWDQTKSYTEQNGKDLKQLSSGKLRTALTAMILSGVISACGGSGGGESASKDLFSRWTSTETGLVIDAKGATFGMGYSVRLAYAINAGCDCTLTIDGTQASGRIYISSCSHYGPVNYCPAGTSEYTYQNQQGQLTMCDPLTSDCEIYR